MTSVNANVNVVTILLGNGAGGFLKATGSPISVGSDAGPGLLALGDLNQDGKPDLAVVSGFGSFLTILLGDGAGGFTEAAGSPISVRFGSESVAVADFNLDGKLDLAVTNSRSNDVTILLGNGGGQFSAAAGSPVSAGDEPFSLAVGDFNLDGKPDLVVANLRSNNVTIQLNTCLACTSTCPSNVTTPNDPNQCGAVVTFAAQSSCSPPACSPASGSFLPVGTTTVTCNSNGAGPCSFSVTVRDTQAPTINCAANTTASAQAACPPSATAVGNFTVTATDNCPGVSVVCRDQNNQIVASGQAFPVGMTTVTCSATDSSDNTAQCSFAVSAFSFCLQDESNPGNVVLVNAQSGDFSFCCGGVTIASGRGTLTTRGCIGAIDGTKGDRKVHIQWDTSSNSDTGAGTASLQKLSNKVVCQITDKNLSNNTCQCSNGPPLANPKK